MGNTVFETEMTLYTSLGNNHRQSSVDILDALRRKHPEYGKLTWCVTMSEYDDGTARLRIAVIDPAQPSTRENFNLVGTIVIVMLFLAIVLYA